MLAFRYFLWYLWRVLWRLERVPSTSSYFIEAWGKLLILQWPLWSNAFFHVVYCHLVSLELENLGYSTQLIPLPVKDCLGEEVWEGAKHKYWQLDTYYLPVCQSMQDSEWCLILFFKDNLRSASNKLQVSILLINEVLIYLKKKFQYSLMLVLSFYLWIWRVKILLKKIIMEFSTYRKYMASHFYWFEPTMAMKLETISSRMY